MEDVNNIFNNSELSLAAYSNLSQGQTIGEIDKLTAKNTGMTVKQAQEFAARYSDVVAVQPETTAGFSATVFREAGTNQLTVAIRGTVPGYGDLNEDAYLTGYGAAYYQIKDMYNWWQKVSHAGTEMVDQYDIQPISGTPPPGALKLFDVATVDFYLVKIGQVSGTGELANEADLNGVTVTGHSLGGHLASAFTALFSDQVAETYTYNGPGFTNTENNQAFFAALEGVAVNDVTMPSDVANLVTRIQANNALPGENQIDAISSLHGGTPGTLVQVAIEDKGFLAGDLGTGNHSIVNLTDSLALFKVLGALDSALSVTTFNEMFHAASNDMDASRERFLDSVLKIFGIAQSALPVGDESTQRNAFYTAIYDLIETDAYASLINNANVDSSLKINGQQAVTDFGAFLALQCFSPVYIAGAALQDTNAGLYSQWSAGNFSLQYCEDRAAMLHEMLSANSADTDYINVGGNTYYKDEASDIVISTPYGVPFEGVERNRILFGDDSADTFSGGTKDDHLYGGGGADVLSGGAGNDYLEGGAGADTLIAQAGLDRLNGGEGNDTYQMDANFGNVIISGDTDGGTISLLSGTTFHKVGAGAANTNGLYVAVDTEGKWLAGKEGWTVSVSGSTATITVPDSNQKTRTIVIDNFDINTNKFGITFAENIEQTAPEQTSTYNVGDGFSWNQDRLNVPTENFADRSVNYNADSYLYHYGYAKDGGQITAPYEAGAAQSYFFDGRDKADVLHGSDWKSTQQSLFNTDTDGRLVRYGGAADADSSQWVGDILQGYDGDDIITGDGRMADATDYNTVGDNDILVGGRGNDAIYGGAGNDQIFAWQDMKRYSTYLHADQYYYTGLNYDGNEYQSAQEALYHGDITIEDVGEKNYLDGGSGDDLIVGASYDDTIDGGSGVDQIMAGAGRDTVYGGSGNDVIYTDSFMTETNTHTLVRDFIAPDVLPGTVQGQGLYSRAYFYRDGVNMDTLFNPDTDYNDVVDGGDGDDTVLGEIGDDHVSGGAGNDVLFGDRPYSAGYFGTSGSGFQKLSSQYHGDDAVDGGTGDDKLIGGGGDDYLLGGEGNDTVYGDVGVHFFDRKATNTVPGDEADAIKASDAGWWGKDFIAGGAGNDVLVGEGNDDTLDGGEGNDLLFGDWQYAQVEAFNDAAGHTGNDTLYGGAGNDQLMGNSGDDMLDGGIGDDTLYGDSFAGATASGTGNDVMTGGAGNDALYGGAGDDTLDGGTGNDTLAGDAGNDLYWVGAGGGIDTLVDTEGSNTLHLSSQPVTVFMQGDNAVIHLSGDGSQRIQMSQQSFEALGGVYVNGDLINLEIDVPDTGSTLLTGTGGNDTFVLGDEYTGDHFLMDAGSGNNVVQVTESWLDDGYLDVNVLRDGGGYDLVNHANPSGALRVWDSGWDTISHISLAAGGDLGLRMAGTIDADTIHGIAGNDAITGGNGDDWLYGGAGDDVLVGGAGNDHLAGGAGNDTLQGDGGFDVLLGEEGDDTLYMSEGGGYVDGGAGNDTIIGAVGGGDLGRAYGGSGADIFQVSTVSYGTHYTLGDESFDAGDVIQLDVNADSVHMHADGIAILTPDKSAISHVAVSFLDTIPKEIFWERMQNLTVRFANGEIWDANEIKLRTSSGTALDDVMIGDALANTLDGMAGNDRIHGGAGNDVLVGGVGYDDLAGGIGNDVFHFGIGSEHDRIRENDLARGADADVIYLESGVSTSDVALAVSNNDLLLTIKSTGETLTVTEFFNASETRERNLTLSFNGGTVWNTARIHQEIFKGTSGKPAYGSPTTVNNTITGTSSSHYMYGDAGNDTINGAGGNDWIDGGVDNDTLTGGTGSDVFRFGTGVGHDVVTDATVSDTVRLDFNTGMGDLTLEVLAGNELKIGRHNASGTVTDSIRVNKALGYLVDVQGNDMAVGERSLLDMVTSQLANQTITLAANTSEDRFVTLSAKDILADSVSGEEAARWNIVAANRLSGAFSQDDNNLDGDSSTQEVFFLVKDFWGSGVNYVLFQPTAMTGNASFSYTLQRDDGLTVTASMGVAVQTGTLLGTAGNDVMDGTQSDVGLAINGGAGNDVILDSYGSDVVHGGDGNDRLQYGWGANGDDAYYGDAGDDTLDAGWGTDTMVGGTGNDLYIENNLWSGDHTTIDNNSTTGVTDEDTLQLGGVWDYRALWFTQDGTDLLVNQLDELGDGEIRIKGWYAATDTNSDGLLNDEGAGRLDVIRAMQEDGSVHDVHLAYGNAFDVLVQAMADFGAQPASVSDATQDSNLNAAYENAWTLAVPAAA